MSSRTGSVNALDLDVVYVISHGFAARMILHSSLLEETRALGLKVGIVSPEIDEASLRERAEALGVSLHRAPPSPASSWIQARFRPYLYEDILGNPALRAKHLRALQTGSAKRRLEERLKILIHRILQRLPFLRNALAMIERRGQRSAAHQAILETLRPTLLVCTYPVNPLESHLLYAAQRLNIATVGHLLSWDNITCKGRFPVVPEHFIAWGPVMTEEIGSHYGVPASETHAVGVPHFDQHTNATSQEAIRTHLAALDLDAEKPYLFFGMSAPYFAPREIDIVEWLASEIEKGRWGRDVQLLVRPHPQNVQGDLADESWLPRLERLPSAKVAVDWPTLRPSRLLWSMDKTDMDRLANLLAGATVTLNTGSTLSIDAIVHDRPVVLTSFDASDALPWWQSARRTAEYHHLAKLIDMGGLTVTRSFEELDAAIQAYLEDPGLHRAGRENTRARQLTACDGQASSRAAQALRALCEATTQST